MRTYKTIRTTTVDYAPSSEPLPPARRVRRTRVAHASVPKPRGSIDVIPEGFGMCSLDACIPIEVGHALVKLFNAGVKAR